MSRVEPFRRARLGALALAALVVAARAPDVDAGGTLPAELAVTLASTATPDANGVREALFIDVYACSIFTADDGQALLARDFSEPVTIRFDITTDMLPDAAPAPWQSALDPVLDETQAAALARAFRSFGDGDALVFGFVPDTGTFVYANRERLFHAPGDALVRAVTDMLLGTDPVSPALRNELISDLEE